MEEKTITLKELAEEFNTSESELLQILMLSNLKFQLSREYISFSHEISFIDAEKIRGIADKLLNQKKDEYSKDKDYGFSEGRFLVESTSTENLDVDQDYMTDNNFDLKFIGLIPKIDINTNRDIVAGDAAKQVSLLKDKNSEDIESKKFSIKELKELLIVRLDNSHEPNKNKLSSEASILKIKRHLFWLLFFPVSSLLLLWIVKLNTNFSPFARDSHPSAHIAESEPGSEVNLSHKSPLNEETKNDSDLPYIGNQYNVTEVPSFMLQGNDPELESIINNSVSKFIDTSLHKYVSVSLIDLGNSSCCSYAGFNDFKRRYPASLVKLFWVVMLYGRYESNDLHKGTSVSVHDEMKAIHDSDNEAASRILDAITGTTSSKNLEGNFQEWFSKRMIVNSYFEEANYENINISQKTFPIPYLDIYEPIGNDLKIRQINLDGSKSDSTVRNYLTTFEISRLIYEIATGEAISNDASYDIKQLMLHKQTREAWENIPYNAIKGFLGEFLPEKVNIYTKIGYTKSFGRQEAALIESDDGKIRYVLVIFANDPVFSADDSKVFPEISRFIYESMQERAY